MTGPGAAGDSRRAGTLRPRYGRLGAFGGAVAVTLVAVLGGSGVLPGVDRPGPSPDRIGAAAVLTADTVPGSTPAPGPAGVSPSPPSPATAVRKPAGARTGDQAPAPAVPSGSGSGHRVVFDMSDQRVWLVDAQAGADVVQRTYLVSGSVTDNLRPGSYAVYSRSLHAVGVDDSGTMRYMVRFTRGQHAAIGFHDIPVQDGRLVQTRDDLGMPQSHGCVRQWRPDAQALWAFAPVGTKVVVVA